MKKKVIIFIFIVLFSGILIIVNEYRKTCLIDKSFSNPIKDSIKFNLENIYNQKVSINSIDGCVEDNSRIVYFTLLGTGENKIVLYLRSYLPNRLKYIDEVQNIKKYKNYF